MFKIFRSNEFQWLIRNKRWEYLIYQIKELETNSKNRNIRDLYRGIIEFKRGYVPGTNVLKDEECDLMQIPTAF
jgi:hypothetical protein